ncbi:MAG: GNAT family N-acetyltransferase [Actinobacteria bacterium]|nr:GNAT family N-acetyltransferase [Actinomycetota bacterium]
MSDRLSLRPLRETDLEQLDRLAVDPDALRPFGWFGYQPPGRRRARWEEDGFIRPDSTMLAVALDDVTLVGIVSWMQVPQNGPADGCLEIGVAIFPEHRGQGYATEAQRALVEYLFDSTLANRLQATTDIENIAEQHALERIGFQREGVQRQAVFRAGGWHDQVMYALLRDEALPES